MTYEEFKAWLSKKLVTERNFQTLGGRSFFHVRYDDKNGFLTIKVRTGYQGQLREEQIRRVFERYLAGSQAERDMTSFFCDPLWPETPSRILAPYMAAVIKVWVEEKKDA